MFAFKCMVLLELRYLSHASYASFWTFPLIRLLTRWVFAVESLDCSIVTIMQYAVIYYKFYVKYMTCVLLPVI